MCPLVLYALPQSRGYGARMGNRERLKTERLAREAELKAKGK